MCRSEPSRSTSSFNSSGNVAICVSHNRLRNYGTMDATKTRTPRKYATNDSVLLHGLPHDFFDGRHAFHDLAQAASTQRDHPFVDSLAPKLEARGTDEN